MDSASSRRMAARDRRIYLTGSQHMDLDAYWRLIEESRRLTDNAEERANWLKTRMTSAREALDFHIHSIRLSHRSSTWPVNFAAELINGDSYDEGFDDRSDLATVPIVLLGHEGGIHLIARDLREFFRFLGSLDCPIACDWQYVFYEEEETAAREEYLAWLDEQFGLTPADDPDDVIEAAKAEFQERFDAWVLVHFS